MFFRVNKLLGIAFLLFVVSAVSASATVIPQDAVLTTSLSPAGTSSTISDTTGNLGDPVNANLANLGRELLQPPVASSVLNNADVNLVKPLPAVPAAMLMVLTGFLCVSFVRDRRVWLTILAGLLWAGQTGIQALPQFALRLSHTNHSKQQLYAELTYPYYLENSHRLRSDIEGTRYIGLLRHLAGIPQGTMSFLRKQKSRQTENKFRPSQSAITRLLSRPIPAINCLAPGAEQFICFSPAFAFGVLPRSPPNLT